MQFPTTSGAHSHWPSKIVISRVISWNLKISHRWGWKPSVHISSKIRGNLEKYYKNTAFQEKVLRGSFQWVSVSIVCDHSNTRFPTFLLRILSNQTGKMVEHGFFVQNTVRKLLEVACYRRKSPGSLLLWEWCSWLCMIWSSFFQISPSILWTNLTGLDSVRGKTSKTVGKICKQRVNQKKVRKLVWPCGGL